MRWNELVSQCANQWVALEEGHQHYTQHQKAKADFINMFEKEWVRRVHRPATSLTMREEKSEDAAAHCFVTSFEV